MDFSTKGQLRRILDDLQLASKYDLLNLDRMLSENYKSLKFHSIKIRLTRLRKKLVALLPQKTDLIIDELETPAQSSASSSEVEDYGDVQN